MQLQSPFRLVTPTLDGPVLEALANADAAFTPPQLQRLIGAHSPEGIRKALRRLVAQGVVDVERVGHADRYALNREHLASAAIIEIAHLRQEFLQRTRAELARWPIRPVAAALFGSAARSEMEAESDLDLLVVSPDGADEPQWEAQVHALSQRISRWTGNDTRALSFVESDFARVVALGDPLIVNLAEEAIWLIGSRRFLRNA